MKIRSGALAGIQNNKSMIDGHPGPLEYKIPSLIDEGPKYFMGNKTVYNRNPLLTDTGPGDYNPVKPEKKLSYTILGRSKDPSDLQMPGPGHYDNEKSKFVPGAGLGKSPRCKDKAKKEDSPGPGSYTVEKFAAQNDKPRFGFGSETKDHYTGTKNKTGPGPGEYSEMKVLSDGVPCYSLKDRRKDCRVLPGKESPGPGKYDPSLHYTRHASPNCRIGKSHKSKVANIYGEVPAPNTYKPQNSFVKTQYAAWGMGTNKRPALSQILSNPGPGSYNPAIPTKEGPLIRGKSQVFLKESPGPSTYSPDVRGCKKKAPEFSMGSDQKKTISAKPLNFFPGPGTYDGRKPKNHLSYGFGSSKRMPTKSDCSPGPGAYRIPTKIRNLETYSLNKNKYSFV